jgi:adenylate cyclase class 2
MIVTDESAEHGKHIETEVKIRVLDLTTIAARIEAAGGALAAARVHERNVRYEDAHNSLTPAGRVLRLRQDTRVRLTYKEPRAGDGGMSRTELEVTVSDFETAHLLLEALGFHAAWEYEKYRTTYTLAGCEIVLDETPMGAFIEVEGAAPQIDEVLARIGLADAPRIVESYSELFVRVRERLGLAAQHLTFAAFEGITVPDDAFAP